MPLKQKIFVANWKMSRSYNDSLSFFNENYEKFIQISKSNDAHVVLCPSFDILAAIAARLQANTSPPYNFYFGRKGADIARWLDRSNIILGAQDCSANQLGAYTGQVSAESLAQLGVACCIVGHSERRTLCHETDQDIAQKTLRLLEHAITPIVCVGESKQEHSAGKTNGVIERQLSAVFDAIQDNGSSAEEAIEIAIAYEPVWAIGTGIVPDTDYLKEVAAYIDSLCKKFENESQKKLHISLLYGGSINESNVKEFAEIDRIDGFLIGGASLDFKKFEKIVSLGSSS